MTIRSTTRAQRLTGLTFIAVTALTVAACRSDTSSSSGDSTEPIKVGVVAPMQTIYGAWVKVGAEVGADQVNSNGGMNGRQVEIIFGDSAGDPTKANTEMTRLVKQEKVDFILGPMTSAESLATFPILNAAKIASAASAGSEKITPEVAPYGMAIHSTTRQEITMMVTEIKKRGYQTVASIHDDGVFNMEGASLLKEEAEKVGLTVLGDQAYKIFSTDVSAQLTALKALNPDALVALTTTDTGAVLLGRDQLGWDVPIVGNQGVTGDIKGAKAVAGENGYHNTIGTVPTAFSACTDADVNPATKTYIAAAQKKANAQPGEFNYFYASPMYDGLIWMDAAVDATKKTDGPSVIKWIEENATTEAENLPLAMTGWQFSATNHHALSDDAFTLGDPNKPLGEGTFTRADCQ